MTTSTNLKNGFKITTMVEQVSKKKPKHRTKAHTVNKYYKPETRATDQNYIENRTKYLAMKEQNAGQPITETEAESFMSTWPPKPEKRK